MSEECLPAILFMGPPGNRIICGTRISHFSLAATLLIISILPAHQSASIHVTTISSYIIIDFVTTSLRSHSIPRSAAFFTKSFRVRGMATVHSPTGWTAIEKPADVSVISSTSKPRPHCILRSPADFDAFQSGRCAEHNGRPETPIIVS